MASNNTNHKSSYNEDDEQDISHVSGCSAGDMKTDIDKDTTSTKLHDVVVLPPEIYAGVMECKFLVCNHII